MISWNNIKIIIVACMAVVGIWLFKNWQIQSLENKRNTENIKQSQILDSLKRAVYIYNDEQIKGYVESNESLKKIIKDLKIKENRIQDITENLYKYSNKEKNEIKVPIPESILDSDKFKSIVYSGETGLSFSNFPPDIQIIKEVPFTDSTECLTIKGNIKFEPNNVIIEINDREFKNKTTAIGYWERRQWSFLGMKTRFLGKVQSTVKVIDQCGESRIIKIEKKK